MKRMWIQRRERGRCLILLYRRLFRSFPADAILPGRLSHPTQRYSMTILSWCRFAHAKCGVNMMLDQRRWNEWYQGSRSNLLFRQHRLDLSTLLPCHLSKVVTSFMSVWFLGKKAKREKHHRDIGLCRLLLLCRVHTNLGLDMRLGQILRISILGYHWDYLPTYHLIPFP